MHPKILSLFFIASLILTPFGYAHAYKSEVCLTEYNEEYDYDDCDYEQPSEEPTSGNGSDQLLNYVRVTSPNGGELLGRNAVATAMTTENDGSWHQIIWESLSTQVSKVDISYSSDYGASWQSIAVGITNSGYFNWTLPNIDTDMALIRINAYGPDNQNLGSDFSNSPFSIHNFQPTFEEVSANTSDYKALYIDQSYVGTVSAGSTFSVNVTFKNIGSTSWYRYSDFPVRLGSAVPRDRYSVFQNDSWVTDYRPAMLFEDYVVPGEVGTFVFTMTAPAAPGDYYEVFAPVADGLAWMDTTPVTIHLHVI